MNITCSVPKNAVYTRKVAVTLPPPPKKKWTLHLASAIHNVLNVSHKA